MISLLKILKKILILFFLIINLNNNNNIKLINSFEIVLKIDFNSVANYSNYECGGSLNIVKENEDVYYQSNTTIYPPCKSFGDAGERSRQFYENGINYYDVSLIISIQNPSRIDWMDYTITSNICIGTIKYYCYFEIIVENDPNAVLTIDGTGVFDYFLNYEGYSNGFITCSSNQLTRVKLSNIRFIDWRSKCLKFGNNNSSSISVQSRVPTIIDLSNIKTERVFNFIFSYDCVSKAQVQLKIRDSVFDGMMVLSNYVFILYEGFTDIENCTFKKIDNVGNGIIINNFGYHLNANNIHFFNIKLKDSYSFFNIFNSNSRVNNITVEQCDFSNFLALYCHPKTSENCGQSIYIQNINFKNNQIKLNRQLPTFFSGIRVFNFEFSPTIYIENITIELNNKIDVDKEIFNFDKNKYVSLKNIQIPQIPQFSSSIVSNKTKIDIDNHSFSLFNSKVLCIGSLNNISISVQKNESEKVKTEIFNNISKNKRSCIDCNITFIIIIDDIIGNSSGEFIQFHDIEEKHKDYKFKKILIIPIVLSILFSLIIILGVVFRKKIKQSLKNLKENEIIGVENELSIEMDINQASVDNILK